MVFFLLVGLAQVVITDASVRGNGEAVAEQGRVVWLIFAGQFKFVLFSVLLSIFVPHILTLLEIPAIIICSFLEKKFLIVLLATSL